MKPKKPMPLSYTWQLTTFFSRDMKLVNHNLHQQLQTGLIEQSLALVGNTLGIRSVYGWYTVLFLFKPFFAILLFAKPNFGDCLIPKIKSYSGCSASRCAEELNFMMVSNDCESSLHHFPFSQLHCAIKLIAECARQISPQNNGFCSLPQRNANF